MKRVGFPAQSAGAAAVEVVLDEEVKKPSEHSEGKDAAKVVERLGYAAVVAFYE